MANDVVKLRRDAARPEIGDVVGWDGEGWVPLAVFSRRGIIGPRGLGEWLKIGQSMEGPDIDLHMGNGTIGRGGDSVLVFDAGGEPVAEFAATNAGFAAALAAAGSGDLIQLPAALTLSAAHTIAAGVTVRGPCVISASGAYGNLLTLNGTLEEVEIAYTAVNGGACIYNASVGCTLRRVEAVTTCTTGGTAYGALLLDLKDTTRICDCYLAAVGNYTGAVRYGLRVTTPQGSDGRKIILSNVMGYGYANSASATCYGIYVEGTQERTLLTGCLGYGWADWNDGTAVGIYAENATMTGCIGRGAFGLVQAGIQMAHGEMFGCSGVAVPQGAGAAYGIRAGYDASVVGCRGEGRYGIYCDTGGTSCRIIGGEAVGSTTDLYVHSGTAHVYGVQYDSTAGEGTLSQAAGDRVGLDELASNANAEGASLVGIEDAGGLIAATDVEGALAELAADAHVAVTLSADLDANLLALAGQELDLDTQAANQVLAGPATGAAVKPAFRVLVDGDIPNQLALTRVGVGAAVADQDGVVALAETSDPSNVASVGNVYAKDDGGETKLYLQNDAGGVFEIAEIVEDVTKTVKASGGDFTTIQAAVDWFKGRVILGACKIAVDAAAYDEVVVFSDMLITPGSTLTLEGDIRALAGIAYVDGCDCNPQAWANGGTFTDAARCTLAANGARDQITVAGGIVNPDFHAGGWGNGDEIIVYADDGIFYERIINSINPGGAGNNVIEITVALPVGATLGTDGCAIGLKPNRAISRTVAGECVRIDAVNGIVLDGWFLKSATGALCIGIHAHNRCRVEAQNILTYVEDWGFYVVEDSIVLAQGASAFGGSRGFMVNAADLNVNSAVSVAPTQYGFYNLVHVLTCYYAIAVHADVGFKTATMGYTYALLCNARQNNTGYYADGNSYVDATSTGRANNGNAVDYNPAPAGLPGYGNGNGDAVLYASN